jgi:hypothetical protein
LRFPKSARPQLQGLDVAATARKLRRRLRKQPPARCLSKWSRPRIYYPAGSTAEAVWDLPRSAVLNVERKIIEAEFATQWGRTKNVFFKMQQCARLERFKKQWRWTKLRYERA